MVAVVYLRRRLHSSGCEEPQPKQANKRHASESCTLLMPKLLPVLGRLFHQFARSKLVKETRLAITGFDEKDPSLEARVCWPKREGINWCACVLYGLRASQLAYLPSLQVYSTLLVALVVAGCRYRRPLFHQSVRVPAAWLFGDKKQQSSCGHDDADGKPNCATQLGPAALGEFELAKLGRGFHERDQLRLAVPSMA